MKTKTTEYLIEVKKIEKKALDKLNNAVVYELKYNRKKKASSILYNVIKDELDSAYKIGYDYGIEISKKIAELESGMTEREKQKYIVTDRARNIPQRFRLSRKETFDLAMKEIDIERQRFFDLYDVKVNAYLKDGYSRNQSRTNIEIMKLENEVINRTRRIITGLVFLNAQIGQFTGMKK